MRDAARRRGVSVKAGYNHRFHPGLMAAKKIVAAGSLGPLYYIRGATGMAGGRATSRNGAATGRFPAAAN